MLVVDLRQDHLALPKMVRGFATKEGRAARVDRIV